mmetsp:Transcript_3435/g.3637  ORF Transcript_3435/g.3637 Transcript_3435/m.3637 type:complete len:114 (-) Transcript_3435:326-667(-)
MVLIVPCTCHHFVNVLYLVNFGVTRAANFQLFDFFWGVIKTILMLLEGLVTFNFCLPHKSRHNIFDLTNLFGALKQTLCSMFEPTKDKYFFVTQQYVDYPKILWTGDLIFNST